MRKNVATRSTIVVASLALLLAACGDDATPESADPPAAADAADSGEAAGSDDAAESDDADDAAESDDADDAAMTAAASPEEQLDAIAAAVDRWESADDLAVAKAAAEEARNLVTGPDTFDAGDLDGDGITGGEVEVGLLPGEDGQEGLAQSLAGCELVDRDVLGGSWDDPAARWATLGDTIDAWAPDNNTFPTLPSHPQRIIGWATLTLETDSLDEALEYSSHAQLHVDVSRTALESCG